MRSKGCAGSSHPSNKSQITKTIMIESLLALSYTNFSLLKQIPTILSFATLGTFKSCLTQNTKISHYILAACLRMLLCTIFGIIAEQNMFGPMFSIFFTNSLVLLLFAISEATILSRAFPFLIFGIFLGACSFEYYDVNFSTSCEFISGMSFSESFAFEFLLITTCLLKNRKTRLEKITEENQRNLEEIIHLKKYCQTLSHELRNPLNSLLGNISLAQAEKLTPALNDYISSAKACGEFLLQFINNVLDSGKMEAGRLEIYPTRVDPREFFRKLWKINSDVLRMKKIEGQFRINNVPNKIKIDPHRVSQVLFNLIGNSIKFTDKGAIKVILSWCDHPDLEEAFHPIPYSEDEDEIFKKDLNLSIISQDSIDSELDLRYSSSSFSKGYLKIIVSDSGIGMTPFELGKLFTRFAQVGEEGKRQLGSGLGLNIAKELCRNMGGDLKLFSKKGEGTTAIAIIESQIVLDSGELSEENKSHEVKKVKVGAFLGSSNESWMKDYVARYGGEYIDMSKIGNLDEAAKKNKLPNIVYSDKEMDGKFRCFLGRMKGVSFAKEMSYCYVCEKEEKNEQKKFFEGVTVNMVTKPFFFDEFVQSLDKLVL